MAKNNLVRPLSPALSQNQSKDLFLRKSYTFSLFSLLNGYQLIAATPAITLYRIEKPRQIKISKIRRVTSIFWLHVESPDIRTGPNIIQHVKPDSYIILHTFMLSSFIFSSILKQSSAMYSLSINMILLRPCLSITNLRIENDFCSSSAKFCFSEFSMRQSSLTPQWKNVAKAVAAMKFMPWVQRISSSIKLQADSTLFRQPLNFILNSYFGGVLPRSFSICLVVQGSTCLFYSRSLSLGSFSYSLRVANQYQMAGLSFSGKPSHDAIISFYQSTFLFVFKIKIHSFSDMATSSFGFTIIFSSYEVISLSCYFCFYFYELLDLFCYFLSDLKSLFIHPISPAVSYSPTGETCYYLLVF